MQTSNIVIIWYIRDIRSAFFAAGDSWLWLEYCLILPECGFPALYPHVIPGSVVNIVLYCRREEVLPETFALLIPPALPAPPIYEVMGDHGSSVEPPPASEPTWMPPVGYVTISEEHNVATAAGGGTQDANCEAPERMSPTYCRHNVYHTDSKILYRLKRFLCTKRIIPKPFVQLKTFSWYHLQQNGLSMFSGMPPSVSAQSLRCFAIRSLDTAAGRLRGVVVNDGSKYRIQKI